MQQFAHVQKHDAGAAYLPLSGFTAVDLGYQRGDAVSSYTQVMDEPHFAQTYLSLFDQIWHDQEKLRDVTAEVLEHIESVYQENPAERVYFMILFNLFSDFLSEIDEDVLPKDRTGYLDSLVWQKLFNFQRDAAVGVINVNRLAKLTPHRRPKLTPFAPSRSGPEPTELITEWRRIRP